jgi:hypothetical protein
MAEEVKKREIKVKRRRCLQNIFETMTFRGPPRLGHQLVGVYLGAQSV